MEKDLFIKPKDLIVKLSTQDNLKILDATFYLPNSDLIAKDEYDKKHIPNAVFFDINKINYVDIFLICCLSAFVPMVGNLMLAGALGKMRSYFSSSSVIVKMNIFSGAALIIVGLCISLL